MISNVCKIEKGSKDLEAILLESEKVARYNDLTKKQSLHLRLICEEIDGMLPNLLDDFNGNLWIEIVDGVCRVNVALDIPEINTAKKEELINLAKNKKNAAAVGIVGKIRNAIENFFLRNEEVEAFIPSTDMCYMSAGFGAGVNYSCLWTLNQYKSTVKGAGQEEGWDELEKSIIANLADDVVVGVKGNKANIVVVKKF